MNIQRQFLCGFLGVSVAWVASAQDLYSIAQMPLPFNAILRAVYPDTNGFTIEAILELPASDSPASLSATIHSYGSKMCTSFLISDIGFLPIQTRESVRPLPLNEIRTILDFSTKRIQIIFPRVRGYIEMQPPSPADQILTELTEKFPGFNRVPLEKERCQGFDCQKIQIIDPKSPKMSADLWERLDFNHFPMKVELRQAGRAMRILVQSVELTKPKKGSLEVPQDFTRYATSAELIKAAVNLTWQGSPQDKRMK